MGGSATQRKKSVGGAEIIDAVESLVRAELDKDAQAIDRPPDPATYAWSAPTWYVVETWQQWRNHGILPVSGGWDDQPRALIDDWHYLSWWYNYIYEQLSDGERVAGGTHNDETQAVVNQFASKQDVISWSDLTNG